MKLRAWPGALCMIIDPPLKGNTIVVTQLSPWSPPDFPCWEYEGTPFVGRSPGGAPCEVLAISDSSLRPITPPPGSEDVPRDTALPKTEPSLQ